MVDTLITDEEINILFNRVKKEAEQGGYQLNPDTPFVKMLLKGMIINQKRYGYMACPCRLATGRQAEDLDIICPCDYRDPDLNDYSSCYCGLYVSPEIVNGTKSIAAIPERRLPSQDRAKNTIEATRINISSLPLPVWRCKVCGYLCARDNPPEICPICKVKKERFERFI